MRAFARLFHASTGEHGSELTNVSPAATLEGHTDRIETLCFTKDGSKLVSGSRDKTVRLWDVGTGTQIGEEFSEHTSWVRSVSISANEQEIFSVGEDGAICVWGMDGRLERRVQFADEGVRIWDAKIISDGEKVVWCDRSWVYVTDVRQDFSAVSRHSRHNDPVNAICITPDGTRAISGCRRGALMVWDTATGLQVGKTIRGHWRVVSDVAVTPDGQRFVSVSHDREVRVWGLETCELLAVLKEPSTWVNCMEISLDGKAAITGPRYGPVRIWDLDACDGGQKVLEGHSGYVKSLYLAQDGKYFVSLSTADAIMWNMETADVVMVRRIEKDHAYRLPVHEVEELFGVLLISNLRMGDIRLGKNGNKITYQPNNTEFVLATMDSDIKSMDFSSVTKSLCVGLQSGHVGIFKLEPEDDHEVVEAEG